MAGKKGWFSGLFGKGPAAKAAEMALEMCIIDEIEADAKAAQERQREREEYEARQVDAANWKAKLWEKMSLLRDLSLSLERDAGMDGKLGVETFLRAFYCGIFYNMVSRSDAVGEEKEQILTELLSCCPRPYVESGQELIAHMRAGDDVAQLIKAMENYPLVVLDLSCKAGRKQDGTRFLQAFADGMVAAGKYSDCRYPELGMEAAAAKTGDTWLAHLQNTING